MSTIAFLGLGLMGAPMAGRLADAGHQVAVWNRNPARAGPLARRGARPAATPADAAARAAVIITMLADAAAVRGTLAGPDGALAGLAGAPATLIQSATVSPDELAGIAALLPARVTLLDAPVLGSVPQARSGELRILVGGPDAAFRACQDVLAALGEPVRAGAAGQASALKLVLNAAVAPMITLLGEALALGDALGLDEELLLDELARSRIGPLVARKRDAIAAGQFPADSRLALFAKDMRLAVQAGAAHGLAMRLAGAAGTLAEEAVAAGLGDLDYAALVAMLRAGHRGPSGAAR